LIRRSRGQGRLGRFADCGCGGGRVSARVLRGVLEDLDPGSRPRSGRALGRKLRLKLRDP
jgi:hypothetical protein